MTDANSTPDPQESPYSPEELKKAYKAFKKRLKLTRLDEDSRLGRSPLTGGSSGVTAVIPPSQYPRDLWEELVRQGKLRNVGHGFYELAPK